MGNKFKKTLLFMTAVAVVIVGASCSKEKTKSSGNTQKEELAQQFMQELQKDILPSRENPTKLAGKGVLVTIGTDTKGIEYLGAFYEKYKAGEDCSVTIAFSNIDPLVVSRVQFVDGGGYYFRYELDEKQDIAVTSKELDRVEVVTKKSSKVDFSLYYKKKDIATFSFGFAGDDNKNADEEAAQK